MTHVEYLKKLFLDTIEIFENPNTNWEVIKDYMMKFNHPDVEINELKTILVLTKGFENKEEIKDLRIEMIDLLNNLLEKSRKETLLGGELLKNIITSVRKIRNNYKLKFKDLIILSIKTKNKDIYQQFEYILKKQISAQSINYVEEPVLDSIPFVIDSDNFYIQILC